MNVGVSCGNHGVEEAAFSLVLAGSVKTIVVTTLICEINDSLKYRHEYFILGPWKIPPKGPKGRFSSTLHPHKTLATESVVHSGSCIFSFIINLREY